DCRFVHFPAVPFSLLALCGHEQPDCQEGLFLPGTDVRHRRTFSPHLSISPVNEPCAGCQRMSPAAPLLPGHAGHGLVVFQLCGRCVVCGLCRASILAGLAGMQG
ncbi:hypothetical protein RCO01_08800, partial [Escherichia coli]|nr:hypothetical protein [Escherichia coli]MED9708710.1 hypothetical protein [Escherichia coli]MED9794807.1 hypothetical protein [Escherichia coli]